MSTENAVQIVEQAVALSSQEAEVLRAIRSISFGTVEVVIHDDRITEIRQTRRTRLHTPTRS